MTEQLLIWIGFGVFVLAMLALDLTAGVGALFGATR